MSESTKLDIKEQLSAEAYKLGFVLSTTEIEKFNLLHSLLYEWNERMNLTSVPASEAVTRHYLDSISCLKKITIKKNSKIIDVGTGAGFPGLPLAILKPKASFLLLDSIQKKLDYIELVKHDLELDNVSVLHARAEDLVNDDHYKDKFDFVLSRAVAPLKKLLPITLPFINTDGRVVAMKGPEWRDELEEASEALDKLGGKLYERVEQNGPSILLFSKK